MFLLKSWKEIAEKIKKYTRAEMRLDKMQYNRGVKTLKI